MKNFINILIGISLIVSLPILILLPHIRTHNAENNPNWVLIASGKVNNVNYDSAWGWTVTTINFDELKTPIMENKSYHIDYYINNDALILIGRYSINERFYYNIFYNKRIGDLYNSRTKSTEKYLFYIEKIKRGENGEI